MRGWAIRRRCGLKTSAPISCQRAMRVEVLRSMTLRSDTFGIEPELTAKIFKRGYRVYEVPITYDGRNYDEGKKIWSGFDIDIAYMIAEDLGFRRDQVRFYGMESEDRARMQADADRAGERAFERRARYLPVALGGVGIADRQKRTGNGDGEEDPAAGAETPIVDIAAET